MDNVYEALDEAKAEIQQLKSENRRKEELSASLKKSHHEHLVKIQEANSRIEKQAQALIEKEGEISVTKQLCEDLKCSLDEKESIIKHLKNANDKLRLDCDGKSGKLVEENKVLVLALEEANEKKIDQEQKICSFKEEIEGLKRLLEVLQKKCSEAEKKVKAVKEGREGEDMLLDLEEEKKRIEDELKWKKEQFKHLEEAHQKLKEQFKTSEKEWEMEKSTLLDEISSLQTTLDSQTRISEDLQKRLEMCHQALSHEESRRKRLEVQVSEFQTRFENAFAERRDAESEVASQREEQIGTLRSSLGKKEMLCKEMEYRALKLEQENQELLKSLKDLREAQIHESGSKASAAKLQIKLKKMEQKYQDCSKSLRSKEAEWSSQLKEVLRELNDCKSKLEGKDRAIEELKTEFEGSHSQIMQLKLQLEESEQSTELEKLKDLNRCGLEGKDTAIKELKLELEACNSLMIQSKSKLEGKDRAIEELVTELEGCRSLIMQLKLQLEEAEQSTQLEKLKDFNRSELECKDRAIKELKLELEGCNSEMLQSKLRIKESELQLEKLKDFNRSELEGKDTAIKELKLELEGCNSLMIQSKLRIKESELQLEKMSKDLNDCRSELESKDGVVKELLTELEDCLSQQAKLTSELMDCRLKIESKDRTTEELTVEIMELVLQNEEISVMLMLLKSAISEAQLKFINEENKRDEKVKALRTRIQTLVHIEEQQLVMKKELERYKGMLVEASSAFERAKSELEEKICEGNEVEFELQIWKSFAERLKANLEENYEVRKELEVSLLAQIEIEEILKQEKNGLVLVLDEKDRRIDSLQKQIVVLDEELKTRQTEADASSARAEAEMFPESCDESFSNTTKEKEITEDLRIQLGLLEHDNQSLIQIVGEKNQKIDDLTHIVTSLEEKFNVSLVSFSAQLSEKQAEINMASDAWEKLTSAEILAELEIEEKKMMIVELEGEIQNLQQKLEVQDKSLYASKQQAREKDAELEAKDSEVKRLSGEMEKMMNSDALIAELTREKQNLVDNLCCFLGEMDGKIRTLSSKDEKLMETLERIVESFDSDSSSRVDSKELLGCEKENVTFATQSSPLAKTIEVTSEGRSPFSEVNS